MAKSEELPSDLLPFRGMRQTSLLMYSRFIMGVITYIRDDYPRRFDIGSFQFAILVVLITEGASSREDRAAL